MSEWFGTWFDSEYYHLLYKDRDYTEAEAFVEKLVEYLNPSKEARLHDLACGKGRHSIHLNKLGLNIDGSDYSANSIKHAKKHENDSLHFYEHDMRDTMPKEYDYVLNLFTSFGYFDTDLEHIKTLENIYKGLKPGGTFVFDFMNVDYVLKHLEPKDTVMKDGIEFYIKRELVNNQIIKHIAFEDEVQWHYHKEKVAALRYTKLVEMMKNCGFEIIDTFGSYLLDSFDLQTSKRLIMILRK